jgi:hypothetical protein
MDESYDTNNIGENKAPKQHVVKSLEVFLNNKIYCEKLRNGEIDISGEIFLNK